MINFENMRACELCSLRKTCNQVVVGSGEQSAPLLIVKDYPNKDSDILGEPFSGAGAQHFDNLLRKSGIGRESVFFTNTVKCCPPAAMPPNPEQIQACKAWLWQEIKSIKPKVILTLGHITTRLLLPSKRKSPMSKVVGNFYNVEYIEAQIAPWYNINYLLNRGVRLDSETVKFLIKIREKI